MLAHPALSTSSSRFTFFVILALRAFFFCAVIYAIHPLIDYGTSAGALSLGAAAAVAISSLLAFSSLRTSAFFLLLLGSGFLLYLLFRGGDLMLQWMPDVAIFGAYSLEQHVTLIYLVFFVVAFSTWFFWRFESVASLELLALIGLCVNLLSGHRNFHFDTPAVINSMAWALGVEHLSMLIILGLAILLCTLLYLILSALPARPIARRQTNLIKTHRAENSKVYRAFAVLSFGLLVILISREIYRHYDTLAASRTSNGVGQNSDQGLSPLGFHSALGSTNQPSALVRLEGDYTTNPFSPMLYMRESALSDFNGHEMVLAGPNYDTDISRTRPEEAFVGKEDAELDLRTPLVQSVFLMGEHENAFAVDYPVSFSRLKNPDPGRFKASYKAYSIAPSFSLEMLLSGEVGDPRWSEEEKKHYLVPHPDKRYEEMARQITAQYNTPVAKVQALTDYLSENAIYTLTPNHDIKDGEDPVAPFLFGDRRGYCVHFAHATVYMARALGIPSRIATGYLTDLSQSKDGHILLRMSDRHAWAESYVAGYGWIPFDTKPQQVESHAESPVDMQLLEELMGLIGPGEEIIPEEVSKHEAGLSQPELYELPSARNVGLAALALLLLLFLVKAYLRWGWLAPVSPGYRIKAAYRAVASALYDVGHRRLLGETREEFRRRLRASLGQDTLLLTTELNQLNYRGELDANPTTAQLSHAVKSDHGAMANLSLPRKLLALINPSSVFAFLGRHKW